MIVLDTTVLVYAVGDRHGLRDAARAVVEAVSSGRVRATTTPEAIQEFTHVRARRRDRRDAASLAGLYADLLSPLLEVGESDLRAGLALYESQPGLGAFDAVLSAAALARGATGLISADRAFADVPGLPFLDLADLDVDRLG